ncbi:MAG TPA: YihY/virulence factor BrkB family protein [Verrucomicrobiae bacterium]|nr:YihY/virulence factor BrkB family protein [Verrucomicrobiae bacterium]
MSDQKEKSNVPERHEQGRTAEKPHEIPARGWKSILKRTKDDLRRDHLSTVSAGVGLFVLLGLIPGLAAVISIYGLVSDPVQIEQQFASIRGVLPAQVFELLNEQMKSIAASNTAAGWGAAIGILVALWGGSKGIKVMMDALNITYHENEKRGFIRLNAVALALTVAAVLGVCVLIGLLAVVPALVNRFNLNDTLEQLFMALRWPALFVFFMIALAVLYRYGPSRDHARWRWVSWGAFAATLLWVMASALFALYLTYFNSYNKTYGSLGAIVVLLLWLYLSAFCVLLGAELNSEMERQTERDTTKGPPEPQGRRGDYSSDNLGESRA